MIVKHYSEVEATTYNGEDSRGVAIRPMVSGMDGAPTFVLRYFEIAPGGYTPRHSHPWEHENFIVSGKGSLIDADGAAHALRPGDAAFVPANELHQFRNDGDEPFVMTCTVPLHGHQL